MSSSNIPVTGGSGYNVATDIIGTDNYQKIKITDGIAGSSSMMSVNVDGSISVSVLGRPSISGQVGASVIGTVPVTQVGSWSVSVAGIVNTVTPSASLVSGVSSIITGTSSTLVLAAAPSSQRNYVTQILVTNGAAVGTFVDVVDNGLVIYSGFAAASGGGFSASFPTPLKQPSLISGLYVAARTQASVIVAMSGYTAA